VIICAIAIVDYIRFERACDGIILASREIGGHAYSIGGWPLGREFEIRFDHPITDDDLVHFEDAAPQWRRISIALDFACKVPDSRLADMRKMIMSRSIKITASQADNGDKRE